jgi:Ca2+-dependent lipid-binding protein
MDPYVEIHNQQSGKKFKTKVKKGYSPVFDETFHVPVDSLDDRIIIKMMEKELLSSDFIGDQQFFVSQLAPLKDQSYKDWVALYQK